MKKIIDINKFDTEFEAVFKNINKNTIREKLTKIEAKLLVPENLQIRKVFKLLDNEQDGFVRVRKEITGKTTITIKIFTSKKISGQKEKEIIVDNFENAVNILEILGLEQKAFQETKRELWEIDNVRIMIDEWPFLEPFVEIEGNSEAEVIKVSEKLGLSYKEAIFGPVTLLYAQKYNLSEDEINNKTPIIIFNMENPFIKEDK